MPIPPTLPQPFLHALFAPLQLPFALWICLPPVLSVCIGISLRLYARARALQQGGRVSLPRRWFRRAIPLAAPVCNMLFLSGGAVLLSHAGKTLPPPLVDAAKTLAGAWLLIALIYVVTHSRVKTGLAALVVATLAAMKFFGVLEGVSRFLSDISFTVGKADITAYQIIRFLISLTLLLWLAGAFVRAAEVSLQQARRMRASTKQLFMTLARVSVYTVTALLAISALGIDLTAFAIFGGAIGVGVGFGLQKIASNFLSGLILLLEKSVQVNDMIEMYNGDVSGIVKHTGARYTLVETFDNRKILIPNDDFITQRVTNWTYSNTRGLVKVTINVSYGSDLEKARDLMLEAAQEHPRCLKDPPPRCMLQSFGDLSVVFTLSVWLNDIREKRYTTQSDLLLAIWRKFTDNNIGLPHAPRDNHYATLKKAHEEDAAALKEEGAPA